MRKTAPPRTIALAPARETMAVLAEQSPPTVYVELALKLLGPGIRSLMKTGWTDEVLVEKFKHQDPDAFREMLEDLRQRENNARGERKKKARIKKDWAASRSASPPYQEKLPSRPLNEKSGTAVLLPAPQVALSAPLRTTKPTRNRGIQRPQKE